MVLENNLNKKIKELFDSFSPEQIKIIKSLFFLIGSQKLINKTIEMYERSDFAPDQGK